MSGPPKKLRVIRASRCCEEAPSTSAARTRRRASRSSMMSASSCNHSGWASSSGSYCSRPISNTTVSPTDLTVAAAPLPGEERHLPDHLAAAHRLHEPVGAVAPAQPHLDLALADEEQRRPLAALDHEALGGSEQQRAGAERQGVDVGRRQHPEDGHLGQEALDLLGRRFGRGGRLGHREARSEPVLALQHRDPWRIAHGAASSRLDSTGTHSGPAWSISPWALAQSATAFIDARYWLQAVG